jgi:uncharacterized protein (DUF433 family)
LWRAPASVGFPSEVAGGVPLGGEAIAAGDVGREMDAARGSLHVRPKRYAACVDPLQRIAVDPAVRFGKPCVRGTRMTVGEVLEFLASGRTEQELFADFPQLTHDDVLACLAWAAMRERRIEADPVF